MKSTNDDVIIFIPGFYGSHLKLKTGDKRVWLTAKNALINGRSLAFDEHEMEIPAVQKYQVDGVFKSVDFIPGIFKIDVYGEVIQQLKERSGLTVIALDYDWRQDNYLTVKKLDELVNQLKSEKQSRKISIVAHSMGGLITSYYLRYGIQSPITAKENWAGADKIDKVVMAGVPFRGVVSVLRNMQNGVKFGLNTSLVNHQAIASFESSYQTLFLDQDKILNNQLKPLNNIHNIQTWQQHQWGLLKNHNNVSDSAMKNRVAFVQKQLQTSRQFLNLINAKGSEKINNPLLYVSSDSQPTLGKMVVYQEENETRLIHQDVEFKKIFPHQKMSLMVSGDGTVSSTSGVVPDAYQVAFNSMSLVKTKVEHSKLYHDAEVMRRVLEFLKSREEHEIISRS
ncbi:MAG: alpha/beta hydrolase [Methylococcales bacterium]|nr:alpha/beta hydrolase [Methylococcales bacterium]